MIRLKSMENMEKTISMSFRYSFLHILTETLGIGDISYDLI